MMRFLLVFLLLYAPLFAKEKVLRINACGVVRGAFVVKLARVFSREYKIKVLINRQGGDTKVITALNNHKADIGVGCRALLNVKSEKKLKGQQVAWGVLAFMVHADNPIGSITIKQAKAILKGTITNWKTLGGADAPIHLYLRKPGVLSGVGYSLRKIIFHNLRVRLRKSDYIVANSDKIRKAVAADPYAFAVGDGTSVLADGRTKLLKINGVMPSKKALQSKRYKAARPYYIYMPKNLSLEAKKFVSFALSKRGQKIISNSYAASLDEGKRLLKLLSESATFEDYNSDGSVSMSDLTKQNIKKEFRIFACGITRVAFVQEIMKGFGKKYGVKILTNRSGGVPFVYKKLHQKKSDVSFGCRLPFKTDEVEKDLKCFQVAWGALSFIVNPKNSVDNLSTKEIKKIIAGEITNWKTVGGADAPINLYARKGDNSGVGHSFREILFHNGKYTIKHYKDLVKNSGELRRVIASDPFAIGIDDVTSSQRIANIKILNVDGVMPTKRAILEKDYPLRRPFYGCTRSNADHTSKLFINYVLSSEGQKIISRVGTANLAEGQDSDSQNNFILQQLRLRLEK